MAQLDWEERLHQLLQCYTDGIYTAGELVWAVIILFDGGDENFNKNLWLELPGWIKEKILEETREVHEDSEFIIFTGEKEHVVKKRYLSLKNWLLLNHFL